MQVWREVRFPTVSNSILQTVRKHAAALHALGKGAADISFFTLHNQTILVFKLVRDLGEMMPLSSNAVSLVWQI